MHIWFVELGEPLPFQREQRLLRYGEFTRLLARRGHRITWWASDFSHQTKTFVGEPNSHVQADGVDIVLVHGPGYRRNVGLARIRHLKVYARNLRQLTASEPPPDIIVSAMPTIEACEAILDYARGHGVPVLVDIRDEWPEDYVRWLPSRLQPLGRLALSASFAALRRVCRNATALSAVSERQLEYGVAASGRARSADDRVFHTGARDASYPAPELASAVAAWRKAGISPERFVCSFSGTLSPSRPLGPIIDAVKRLSNRIPITLVVAGRGDMEAEYRARAGRHPSVHFAGWIDGLAMASLFEISDVLLAPYRPDYGFSLPTKIFDYLAAGKPMISSCPGEAEKLLIEYSFGFQYRYDDSGAVEDALMVLYENPNVRVAMGKKARALFERDFAIDTILERYADHLEQIADKYSK
jgi:glycosyltransferase involved in cell wall biosynthesis